MELDKSEKSALELDRERRLLVKDKLKQLAECEEIVSTETINAIGRVVDDVRAADDNAPSSDELDEDVEEDYRNLNHLLDLPDDTYSLTAIKPELPPCVRYGVRSGMTHFNLSKFSPLSRGHQGGATAIAAFATTTIYKSRCWNEAVIDQIIEDGDTFYCESYKNITTDDRRLLSILDLKRDLFVQHKLNVNVSIDEPAYAGKFRSTDPKELHLVKALELFFKRYDSGILTSSVLNIAIWKDAKYYNVFDGQPRKESCEPAPDGMSGAAKLFLVKDLIGVLFVILEKSNVKNEPFVLHAIAISGVEAFSLADDPDEPEKSLGKPQRRPSGYWVQEKFRAVVHGSYHLTHSAIPEILRGKGHLIIALAAIVYSRLVNANKWTSALIDLIFNQANIYLIDLVRVLEKKLDEEFELRIDDLMGDLILGVYSAKVKVRMNVVPGFGGKKGKLLLDTGLREFFDTQYAGILEIRKTFYAVWKHDNTYYFFDPFACDEEGFRINFADSEHVSRLSKRGACVTMNSTIDQVVETAMDNTNSKERDPYFIHGVRVLYVKTGITPGGPFEKVIYREKGTSRRPQAVAIPIVADTGGAATDATPRIRIDADKYRTISTQYPELLRNVDIYTMTETEPKTYIVPFEDEEEPEEEEDEEEEEEEEEEGTGEATRIKQEIKQEASRSSESEEKEEEKAQAIIEKEAREPIIKIVKGYKLINPHRLILLGTTNCFDERYEIPSRGRQGLISALTALAYRKLKPVNTWRNIDIDQLLDVSNKTYDDIIIWIQQGSPVPKEDRKKGRVGEEEEEEEEEEELGEEEEETKFVPAPSHLELPMLPLRLKLAENDVFFKTKMKVINGEASPLANLAEALECYFKKYTEAILENRRLMYAIWREDGKFHLFNPYGSDEEGWRLRNHPASFAVLETLNELVDLLYGILEFNQPTFSLHFVALDSIQPGLYASPDQVVVPDDQEVEMFKTKFLPVTDEDLATYNADIKALAKPEGGPGSVEGLDEEEEEEEEEVEEEEGEKTKETTEASAEEKPLADPLLEVEEQDQPDPPFRLNLILLTSNMKIYDANDTEQTRVHEEIQLEKLKYNHPPPYVMPPKYTLTTLLESKRAKRSIHSLVSRFSIDSRLDVKKKGGLSSIFLASRSAIVLPVPEEEETIPSKMIKLSPKKYLYSRLLPLCLMPLRAINDKYIQIEGHDKATLEAEEKKSDRKDFISEDMPEIPTGIRIKPKLIPLGPTIKTPPPIKKPVTCFEKKKRKCFLEKGDEGDPVAEKIQCDTEDLLLELLFPEFKAKVQLEEKKSNEETPKEELKGAESTHLVNEEDPQMEDQGQKDPEGFQDAEDGIRTIHGNLCMENRGLTEPCHFKSCFFSALLCVLGRIALDPHRFRPSILDQFIFLADKIYGYTGKLRYKPYRWFHRIEILDTVYTIIAKQALYADPSDWEDDAIEIQLPNFLGRSQTGVLVFENCSFAFWTSYDKYYLFDSYSCDDKGRASAKGTACLVEYPDLDSMLDNIKQTVGENVQAPYRIYTLLIAHMQTKKKKKKRRRKQVRCSDKKEEEEEQFDQLQQLPLVQEALSAESESSLIEMPSWAKRESNESIMYDMTIPGFAPIRYYDASVLEVTVLENDITMPRLPPFKRVPRKTEDMDDFEYAKLFVRKRTYERVFRPHSAVLTPLDLCVMAWALIHDPVTWSLRTVRGLFDACMDYTFDSVLATQDSTVDEMTDGLLHDFEIANYIFRAVFAPLHYGVLYAKEGWNLSMSLQKIFETPTYTGVALVCGEVHIGITKKDENYFAWWVLKGTQKLRFITSTNLKHFMKLLIREMGQSTEVLFVMRVVTISYARKLDPDCSDTRGLHESVIPSSSLPEVHKKEPKPYNLQAIFQPTLPDNKPLFVLGTVALTNRDTVTEPKVKRCYFVAVLAVMVKRDIVQSPLPGMIDKILEVGESLYREFSEPKFHTEHILRNVTVMNRIFDFRDCAAPLVSLTFNPRTRRTDFYVQLRKHLKKFFKTYTSGVIQFTNCCYAFWYAQGTNCYYYLDPYACNAKGRKVSEKGRACLCVFSTICQMTKQMCFNQFDDTTGFFIHRIHVESVNTSELKAFKEDPMWLYLDYHWSFIHSTLMDSLLQKKRRKNADEEDEKSSVRQFWNHYAIEVANLIYSVWGTIGCHDHRFGERAGRNQAAICVAVLAMQYLSHPSKWSPAILDSAVICGDAYYTESLRSSAQKCARHSNSFNLQPCFKIFPHLWTIDFMVSICGVLFGDRCRMTLTSVLDSGFEDSPNLLIECNRITLAILAAKDGYYVADPSWIGPPLFEKDHGAIYVLRCRNMNSLVYAVTKIFNTNQRLDIRVTPVVFTFQQEEFDFMDDATPAAKKKMLLEPIRAAPGKVEGPDGFMPGATTIPEDDSYIQYHRNLKLGMLHGYELENPELPRDEPPLEPENETNALISTTWHLHVGQAEPLMRPKPSFDPKIIEHVRGECAEKSGHDFEPLRTTTVSVTDIMAACDDYPNVVDFTRHRGVLREALECSAPRDFINEEARNEFDTWNIEMAHEEYKSYKHRLPVPKVKSTTSKHRSNVSLAKSKSKVPVTDDEEEEYTEAEETADTADTDETD